MAADPVAVPRPRAPQRPRLRPAPPPRRVSGPATRGRAVAQPAPQVPLARVLEALRGLPDSKWLDRLLRGQGWVVLIGIALMGIVAMQVSLLKMNTGIGQSIEKAGALERQNADLRAEVSRLSSEERITSNAGRLGLVMPDAGEVRYVETRGERDARKAAEVMRAPNPPEELAVVAAQPTTEAPTTTATAPEVVAEPQTTTPPAEPQATAAPTTGATTAGATAAPATPTAAPGQ
jgi:cell division protein FtsL